MAKTILGFVVFELYRVLFSNEYFFIKIDIKKKPKYDSYEFY